MAKKQKKVTKTEIELPPELKRQLTMMHAQVQGITNQMQTIVQSFAMGKEIDQKKYSFDLGSMRFVLTAAIDPVSVKK